MAKLLVTFSDAQVETIRQIAGKEGNVSFVIRLALQQQCKRLGIEWPDDLPERGKYERKSNPVYTANDYMRMPPAEWPQSLRDYFDRSDTDKKNAFGGTLSIIGAWISAQTEK